MTNTITFEKESKFNAEMLKTALLQGKGIYITEKEVDNSGETTDVRWENVDDIESPFYINPSNERAASHTFYFMAHLSAPVEVDNFNNRLEGIKSFFPDLCEVFGGYESMPKLTKRGDGSWGI